MFAESFIKFSFLAITKWTIKIRRLQNFQIKKMHMKNARKLTVFLIYAARYLTKKPRFPTKNRSIKSQVEATIHIPQKFELFAVRRFFRLQIKIFS